MLLTRTLGATAPPSGDGAATLLGDVLPWLGALALLAVVGWLAIVFVRRRLQRDEGDAAPFSLDTLRALRREGKLSEEEFARARDAMIAATRRALERPQEGTTAHDQARAGGSSGKRDGSGPSRRR